MLISLGEVQNETDLQRKLEMLYDKVDYGNLVLYQVGDMYYVCPINLNNFTTN
jgi:acetone carboxylase gamma subunit